MNRGHRQGAPSAGRPWCPPHVRSARARFCSVQGRERLPTSHGPAVGLSPNWHSATIKRAAFAVMARSRAGAECGRRTQTAVRHVFSDPSADGVDTGSRGTRLRSKAAADEDPDRVRERQERVRFTARRCAPVFALRRRRSGAIVVTGIAARVGTVGADGTGACGRPDDEFAVDLA